MKAVVTGAAGFIGSHLCERLLADDWVVHAIDGFAPTYDSMGRRRSAEALARSSRCEFIEGDLNQLDLPAVVADADVVFHLAARPGVRASWTDFARASEANILATQRVLDAVASAGSTKLVFASSSSVYGQAHGFPTPETATLLPISPYGVTKAACESLIGAYVSQAGINAASLRYFTVYGPRQRSDMAFTKWIKAALSGRPLSIYGDGSAIRDFTFVGDVVEATYRIGLGDIHGHEVYNVAGGSPATVNEVLAMIEKMLGRDLRLDHSVRAKGDPSRTGGDTTKLVEKTGWIAETSLADGIAAQIAWCQSDPAAEVSGH